MRLFETKATRHSCSATAQKTGKTGTVTGFTGDKRRLFRFSRVYVRRSSNRPDVSLKLTVPATCSPGLLQERSHVSQGWDRRQCFSSVYTKSDCVLNTSSAASPGGEVGLATILLPESRCRLSSCNLTSVCRRLSAANSSAHPPHTHHMLSSTPHWSPPQYPTVNNWQC